MKLLPEEDGCTNAGLHEVPIIEGSYIQNHCSNCGNVQRTDLNQ